jgi:hypothetical protein
MDQVAEKDEKRTFEIKSSLKFHLASVIKFDLFHFKLEKMVVNNLEQFMTPFFKFGSLHLQNIFISQPRKTQTPISGKFFCYVTTLLRSPKIPLKRHLILIIKTL